MKKIIFGLALSSFLTLGVVSCKEENPTNNTVKETTYQLTTTLGNGVELKNLTTATEGKYLPGSEVSFLIEFTSKAAILEEVLLNSKTLLPDEDGLYTFNMPNKNSTLEVITSLVSEEDLLTVGTFGSEFSLPTNLAEVKTLLESSLELNSKYFKEATIQSVLEGKSAYGKKFYKGEFVAGRDNALTFKGLFSSDGKTFNPYVESALISNEHLYSYNQTVVDGKSANQKMEVKTIVDDLEESNESKLENYQVYSKDARRLVSSYNVVDLLNTQYLNSSWLSDASTTLIASKEEDNKSLTITMENTTVLSSTTTFNEFSVTLDGDLFLNHVTYSSKKYDNSFINETGEVIEGAVIKENDFLNYEATRGYKTTLAAPIDVNEYLYQDYDVLVSNTVDGLSNPKRNEGVVYLGENTSFKFNNNGNNMGIVTPYFVGFKEENAAEFVQVNNLYNGTTLKGLKTGIVTALFDNGSGELKEVVLDVKQPKVSNISAYFYDNKVMVDSVAKLSVTATPQTANQEVTITKATGSANCEITPSADAGVYDVKALEVGTIKLVITSKSNPEVIKEVSIEVIAKPNASDIKNTLTTKTLKTTNGAWSPNYGLNFNSDGTGVWATYDMMDASSTGTGSFKWSLDETTITFTISEVEEISNEKIVSFSVISNNEFNVVIDYQGSQDTYTLTPIDRIEFGNN